VRLGAVHLGTHRRLSPNACPLDPVPFLPFVKRVIMVQSAVALFYAVPRWYMMEYRDK